MSSEELLELLLLVVEDRLSSTQAYTQQEQPRAGSPEAGGSSSSPGQQPDAAGRPPGKARTAAQQEEVLLRMLAREHFARLQHRAPDHNLPWLLRQVVRPDMLQVRRRGLPDRPCLQLQLCEMPLLCAACIWHCLPHVQHSVQAAPGTPCPPCAP